MKLEDAIRNVLRPQVDSAWDFAVDGDAINGALALSEPYVYPDELNERLKAYPIAVWTCTDTEVGLYAIWLDGKPVGSMSRRYRRSAFDVRWLSKRDADRVRSVVASYATPDHEIALVGDTDIGEDFAVDHPEQAHSDDGTVGGRPARALVWYGLGRSTPKEHRRADRSHVQGVGVDDERQDHVLVRVDGEERVVPFHEFRLPFRLQRFEPNARIVVEEGIHEGKKGFIMSRSGDPRSPTNWLVEFDGRTPEMRDFEGRTWILESEMRIDAKQR